MAVFTCSNALSLTEKPKTELRVATKSSSAPCAERTISPDGAPPAVFFAIIESLNSAGAEATVVNGSATRLAATAGAAACTVTASRSSLTSLIAGTGGGGAGTFSAGARCITIRSANDGGGATFATGCGATGGTFGAITRS